MNPTTPAIPAPKDTRDNGLGRPCRGGSEPAGRTVAQAVAQPPGRVPLGPVVGCPPGERRPARRRTLRVGIPHLHRRGRVLHFRRRVPSRLRERGARAFLAVSLRTDLPFEAARRAEVLLAALERAERDVDARMELSGAEIDAILGEVARAALARMLAAQDDDTRTEGDADASIAALEDRIAGLRAAARRRDCEPMRAEVEAAAGAMSTELPLPLPSTLGRRAAALLRELAEIEIAVEDGEDVESVAVPIAARFSCAGVRRFAAAPVMFSAAFERTAAGASSPDMRRNTEATGELFLELMGDRPMTALDAALMEQFLHLVSRLPKAHGKAHGRNRFEAVGRAIDKRAEIADAGAEDEAATEALRGPMTCPWPRSAPGSPASSCRA